MGAFDALLGHVIDLNFVTHEAMIEAAVLWQIEEYQFDNGTFSGSINAVHTSHIQIAYTSRSNGIFIKGKTPQNAYLFASIESEGKITHNGLSVYADELVVLNDEDQLDFIVSSAVNDVSIAIDKEFFDSAFQDYFNEPFNYDTINKRIQLIDNGGFSFRTSAKEILNDLITSNEKILNDPTFHEKSEYAILQILFQNIDPLKERKKVLESKINANEIRKYIEMNYKNEISINELCSVNKLSESTLRLGFNNLFGLSPKKYHQSYRLGKVHHAFLQNDCSVATVGSIAYDHGFTHMGRFSSKYKSMFGITPSCTLKETSNLAQ